MTMITIKRYQDIMNRLVKYHKSFNFHGFDTNCNPKRFVKWYMKYGKRRNWLIGAISANSIDELDIKLTLCGY